MSIDAKREKKKEEKRHVPHHEKLTVYSFTSITTTRLLCWVIHPISMFYGFWGLFVLFSKTFYIKTKEKSGQIITQEPAGDKNLAGS